MKTPRPKAVARGAAAALVALALVVGSPRAHAQPAGGARVTVEVDARALTMDDDLGVTLTLEGAYDAYREPGFDDFEVVNRGQSSRITMINGRIDRSLTLSYRVVPKHPGALTIGPAAALRNGRVVARSKPVTVRVTSPQDPASAPPGQRPTAQGLAGKPFFLLASTQRDTYYVGEPFVLSWDLYFRRDVNVESWELVRAPKLDGLLVEELLDPANPPRVRDRRVGSRLMRVAPRSIQLATPLRAGAVTVGSMTGRIRVGDLFRMQRRTIRSRPFTLTIKPLPEEGRPEGFQPSHIGTFNLSSRVSDHTGATPKRLRTGERLVLTVTVSGTGNLVGVKPPEILDPAGRFSVTPSSTEDHIDKDAAGVHGDRTFEYLLTPTKPGSFSTPEVRFAFFDPRKGAYRVAQVPGTPVTVQGPEIRRDEGGAAYEGEDIAPLFEGVSIRPHSRRPFAATPLFWIFVALPLAGLLLVETRYRLRRRAAADPQGRRYRGAHSNARKRLRAAEQAARDGLVKDFYGQLARALSGVVEERANLPVTGMTHDELRARMLDVGYGAPLVDRVITELENCDFARFAPAASADAQMRENLARVRGLIDELARVQPRRSP